MRLRSCAGAHVQALMRLSRAYLGLSSCAGAQVRSKGICVTVRKVLSCATSLVSDACIRLEQGCDAAVKQAHYAELCMSGGRQGVCILTCATALLRSWA